MNIRIQLRALTRALCVASLGYACMAGAAGVRFEGFASTAGLKLNGSAKATASADAATGAPALRLTEARGGQAGSAFSGKTVAAATFSTYFQFRISEPGGSPFDCNTKGGADGIVFVVQSVSSSIGGSGQGIGYAGIRNSVGVEFDTWCNGGNNDPSSNHVGIVINGDVNHGKGSPFTRNISPDFDDGKVWHAWVDYDGKDIEVRVGQSPQRPIEAAVSRPLDLPRLLGKEGAPVSQAFIGFTAATGADWGAHDILYWEYRDNYAPLGVAAVAPAVEPAPAAAPETARPWRGGLWKPYDRGGCEGQEVRQTKLPLPDDDFCDAAAVGTVVVCNVDHGGCSYKRVGPAQCKNGKQQGRMYVCTPK